MSLGGLISLVGMPASSRVQAKKAEQEAKFEPYTPSLTQPDLVGLGDLVMGQPAEPVEPARGGTLYQLMNGGWGPPVEAEAQISPWKPEQERSFAPHEQATLEDVKTGLWSMALGGMAPGLGSGLPGITPGKPQVKAPATPRRGSLGALAKAKPEPDVPAGETYFSQLRRTIDMKHVQETQTADQWLRYLRKSKRKVHEDELKFTGLGDLLKAKGRGRVTKKELREHLDANEIRVEEVTKGELKPAWQLVYKKHGVPSHEGVYASRELAERDLAHLGPSAAATQEVRRADVDARTPTKFESYALPGAENYREVLLRLPVPERTTRMPDKGVFTGGHWDEPNVLAHLRLSDRKVGGKRTLLVEELQSDWAQKGRSEGFSGPESQKRAKEIDAEMEALFRSPHAGSNMRVEALRRERDDIQFGRVPSAPFVGDTSKWTTLALKRVLKMAADEGYDRVGIVRGQEQAARYDLSKQVDSIDWSPISDPTTGWKGKNVTLNTKAGLGRFNVDADGKISSAPAPGILPRDIVGKRIDEVIGKEFADKILRGERGDLSGEGLKVGGEGMKGYYDKIVPEQLNKLGKEFGVKVQIEGGKVPSEQRNEVSQHGDSWIVTGPALPVPRDARKFKTKAAAEAFLEKTVRGPGVPIHTLDIPDPMKQKVKKKGFPLVSSTLRDLIGRTA